MVRKKVEKIMKQAIISLSWSNNKSAKDVSVFIHTKSDDLAPKYFYSIKGQPVLEDGKIKDLDFTQDILGKKYDMLGFEVIASQFLQQYFRSTSREHEIDPKMIYVMIGAADEKVKDLIIALYNGSNVIKQIKLEDMFAE